jgi:Peptidase family M23
MKTIRYLSLLGCALVLFTACNTGVQPNTPATLKTEASYVCPINGPYKPGAGLGAGRNHKGFDMMAAKGTPVVAVYGGVINNKWNADSNPKGGNALKLQGNDGRYYYYAHLQSHTVNKRDVVAQGQVIGYVGDTGNAYNPNFDNSHLHFEIRTDSRYPDLYTDPVFVDPVPLVKAWCANPPPNPTVNFATRTFVDIGGSPVESITAYGKFWNFDVNGNPWGTSNGASLHSVARYATGPCAGIPDGQCTFDTRTFAPDLIESITAYGRFWNFDANGNPWGTSNGASLHIVPRYASGPCAGIPDGQCKFDSRTFVNLGGQWVESITAYGKFWNFDIYGNPWGTSNGGSLHGVGRYATGPCAGIPDDQCAFETRTFVTTPTGELLESISAYGKYFNYRADGSPYPDASRFSGPLNSVARYQAIQ